MKFSPQDEKSFFPHPRHLEVGMYSGYVPYRKAYERQKELHDAVLSGADDQLMLLEHSPVYTVGKRRAADDFLVDPAVLENRGAEVVRTDRGGRSTFHGPGQIVLYIICNLGNGARKVRQFVWFMEESVIEYLRRNFAIDARRKREYPGVWVGDEKIAAVGISIRERVTMHGLALNICTDLSFFDAIIPCGIRGFRVCSLAAVLNRSSGVGSDGVGNASGIVGGSSSGDGVGSDGGIVGGSSSGGSESASDGGSSSGARGQGSDMVYDMEREKSRFVEVFAELFGYSEVRMTRYSMS
ncbi:MAG: lipoyl(octanoyl) transferase LipB [Salinispira sp.]